MVPADYELWITLLSLRPLPVADRRTIDALAVCKVDTVDDLAFQPLLHVCPGALESGNTIDHINRQVEAVDLIADRKFERRVDVALLFIAANMDVAVVGSAIGELVDQPRISMEVAEDRL